MWVFAPFSSFSTESSAFFSLTLKTGSRALLGFSTFSPFQLFSSSRLSTRTFSSIFKNSLSCRLWTSWTSSLPSMRRSSCTSEIQKTPGIHFLSDEMQQNMFLNLWNPVLNTIFTVKDISMDKTIWTVWEKMDLFRKITQQSRIRMIWNWLV